MNSHRLKLALALIVAVALVIFFTRRHSLTPLQDAEEVSSTDQLPSLATNVARRVSKQTPVQTVDDAPQTNQPPSPTFEEISRYVGNWRNRQFGEGKPLSAEEREWLD